MNYKYILILLLGFQSAIGQYVINPSFEGPRDYSTTPHDWFECSNLSTPDTQPGAWGVNLKPSDGNSYVSIVTRGVLNESNDNTVEDISTELVNINPNSCYTVKIDLAYSNTFNSYGVNFKPIMLKVWVSKNKCQRTQLIWASPIIDHTNWRTYTFNFSGDQKYLFFEAVYASTPNYYGDVLLDNIRISENHLDIGMDTLICRGDKINLSVDDFWDNASWSTGSTENKINVNEGFYTVVAKKGNCLVNDSITISSKPKIKIELPDSTKLCSKETVTFDVYNPYSTYLWSTGNTNSKIIISEGGNYNIEIENGCETINKEFYITKFETCCQLNVPNVFTPNNDGVNDVFEISSKSSIFRISDYKLKVYNRWGIEVFTSDNLHNSWDGRVNNFNQAKPGVYYWLAKTVCLEDSVYKSFESNGNVTLLR